MHIVDVLNSFIILTIKRGSFLLNFSIIIWFQQLGKYFSLVCVHTLFLYFYYKHFSLDANWSFLFCLKILSFCLLIFICITQCDHSDVLKKDSLFWGWCLFLFSCNAADQSTSENHLSNWNMDDTTSVHSEYKSLEKELSNV